ncbi:MAG: nuclear transport factor 2 family protein [Armatimonadota bacterium]
MKFRIICSIVYVGSSVAAFAAPVPNAIKARYKELVGVIRKLDFPAFSAFFADDFTTVDPKGKSVTRAEMMKELKGMFDSSSKAVPKETLLSAKSHDGMVDVKFDFTLAMTGKGKHPGVTKIHEVGTDTWKMVGKKWVFIKTVDTKFDVVMPKAAKASKSK